MDYREKAKRLHDMELYSSFFTKTPIKFNEEGRDPLYIYDIPTIYLLSGEYHLPLYGIFPTFLSGEPKKILIEVMKGYGFENYKDFTGKEIDIFRRAYYQHPNIISIFDSRNILESFNSFLKEILHLSIITEKDTHHIKEIRHYLLYNEKIDPSITIENSSVDDLYYFLKFDRFNYVDKEHLKKIIFFIYEYLIEKNIDVFSFKNLNDRDKFPTELVSCIEKLVLENYQIDEKARQAVRYESFNLDTFKTFIGFHPVGWQKFALIYENRNNFFCTGRRSGKTKFNCYTSMRQTLLPNQTVVYIIPNKEGFGEQPMQYFTSFMSSIKDQYELDYDQPVPGIQINTKTLKIVNKYTNSKIVFSSSRGGTKGARSFSANKVVIDEAAFIDDEDVYDISYSSTTDTRGIISAVSTINIDTPINWFFFKKIELDGDDTAQVIILNIYQNPFIPIEEKEYLEKKYKGKNDRVWYAEYMAMFIGSQNEFNLSSFYEINFDYHEITIGDYKTNLLSSSHFDKFIRFVLCRDPARTGDKSGFSIIGVTKENQARIIMTSYIQIPDYFLQSKVIIHFYRMFEKFNVPLDLVLDVGKAGIAMYDYYRNHGIQTIGIYSTGGKNVTRETLTLYNMPETFIHKTFLTLLNSGVVKGYSWLNDIQNEFDTYQLGIDRIQVDHHNDIISSIKNGLAFLYERSVVTMPEDKSITSLNTQDFTIDAMGQKQIIINDSVNRFRNFGY